MGMEDNGSDSGSSKQYEKIPKGNEENIFLFFYNDFYHHLLLQIILIERVLDYYD